MPDDIKPFPYMPKKTAEEKQKEERDELESVRVYKPTVIFNGDCEHAYNFFSLRKDMDGMYHAVCQRCPMGKMMNKEEAIAECKKEGIDPAAAGI